MKYHARKIQKIQPQEMHVISMAKSQKPGLRTNSKTPLPPGRSVRLVLVIILVVLGAVTFSYFLDSSNNPWKTFITPAIKKELIDSKDYLRRAKHILQSTPLIDGHNDFPFLVRQQLHGKIYDHDFEAETLGSQTDFHRMRDGMMGGQFWSVYVGCPEDLVPGVDLNDPNKRIPDLNEANVGTNYVLLCLECMKSISLLKYPY